LLVRSATVPRITARVWLQEPDGLQRAVLFDPAHPALQALEAARTERHSDPRQAALDMAAQLEDAGLPEAAARAEFIRRQCTGERVDALFGTYRERWGIPDYREDLVLAKDFRHGFLWHFRDHSTAFSDNLQAKTWLLCSPEARFVQAYDFEGGLEGEGPYKALVEREVAWGLPGSIEVLDSPVFTLDDYRRFASDPAFEKAQEALRWYLRDAHEASRDDWLTLLDPRPEVAVVCDLARLALYQGVPEQAQTYLDQALGLDQGCWEAWYYLGITYALTGQPEHAAASFRQAAVSLLARPRDFTGPWYQYRMNQINLVTEQLQIYGQAIQRLGAAALETIVPVQPPAAPEDP
jgi:tetratricopeptide (TPR) repeat protein